MQAQWWCQRAGHLRARTRILLCTSSRTSPGTVASPALLRQDGMHGSVIDPYGILALNGDGANRDLYASSEKKRLFVVRDRPEQAAHVNADEELRRNTSVMSKPVGDEYVTLSARGATARAQDELQSLASRASVCLHCCPSVRPSPAHVPSSSPPSRLFPLSGRRQQGSARLCARFVRKILPDRIRFGLRFQTAGLEKESVQGASECKVVQGPKGRKTSPRPCKNSP